MRAKLQFRVSLMNAIQMKSGCVLTVVSFNWPLDHEFIVHSFQLYHVWRSITFYGYSTSEVDSIHRVYIDYEFPCNSHINAIVKWVNLYRGLFRELPNESCILVNIHCYRLRSIVNSKWCSLFIRFRTTSSVPYMLLLQLFMIATILQLKLNHVNQMQITMPKINILFQLEQS